MSKKLVYLLVAVLLVSLILNVYYYNQNVAFDTQNAEFNTRLDMTSLLAQAQFEMNGALAKVDAGILSACAQLSATDLVGSQVRAILSALVEANQFIVNVATADAHDVLLAVEPAQYRSIEGRDISDQEQNLEMHQTLRPAMSDMILLVEGFYGVVMVAPIFAPNQTFVGSLSIVIQPSEIIREQLNPTLVGTPYTFFAVQTDGRILYDVDAAQEGKMTFSDPAYETYPELIALAHHVVAEHSGYGTYQYREMLASEHIVQKEMYWTTVGIYGVEWRLAIVNVLNA
jgi:hypothetical protein